MEHLKDLAYLQRAPITLALELYGFVYINKHLKEPYYMSVLF